MKPLKGLIFLSLSLIIHHAYAQCGGQILEPGFAFLTSSRGCAPFMVRIETLYLSSSPGTQYFVNWGDGTPEEVYTQANATGVVLEHTFPNAAVECGYNISIDAANACNPRGSVVPVTTQVIVWTNDIISMNPAVFRVCQGFAASVRFQDDSDWNCYPRDTRENGEPRWIQWMYGTGSAANRIPGIQVNGSAPSGFPYLDPSPGRNPIYPVAAPGELSLPVNVPVTSPADIGREFTVTLKNWNQCNPYDNVLTDGNAFNPVSGDLVNGDNAPQITTGRIVIVDAPEPAYLTRAGNAAGPVQTTFCIGDNIFFDNTTPPISGASFRYTWEFFDNETASGTPLASSTQSDPIFSYQSSGQKLIRLRVRDANAAGNCEAVFETTIVISPSMAAGIRVTDTDNNPITPDFCQETQTPYSNFSVRFTDASTGTPLPTTQWRWEFYDENNSLVMEAPSGGGFSGTPLGPFDRLFASRGIYRVRLRVRDNLTSCESTDEVQVRVFEKPAPDFSFNRVCEGTAVHFTDASTLDPLVSGEQIVQWEWDMNYNGVTFNKDASLDGERDFDHLLSPGVRQVALRVTASPGGCSATLVRQVTVDPLPEAEFTPDVTSGCSVLRVTFTNEASPAHLLQADQYIWETDDGSGFQVDSIQRPSQPDFEMTYARDFVNTGTSDKIFQVRLRVVSIHGCERISSPVAITVSPGTKSGFNSINYSPFEDNCSPLSVSFAADSETQSLSPSDYTWIVNDQEGVVSETSTGTTPAFTHSFVNTTQSIRDYQVLLRTTLPSGCHGDSSRTIRISPVPSSAFTADTLRFDCTHMYIQFNAVQKGLSEYQWTIKLNGVIMVNTAGTTDYIQYEVLRSDAALGLQAELRTVNFAHCESTLTTSNILVPARDDINASFTVSPLITTMPFSTIQITNTTNPGPWLYQWDFGDGTASEYPSVSEHTYQTDGTYTIRLIVTNNVCHKEQTVTVVINPVDPELDFEYNPSSGCAPLEVTFTNNSRYARQDSWVWLFGDGGSSNAMSPRYTYHSPGIYSVTLMAANSTGDTVRIVKRDIIEVHETPSAYFALKPQTINIPGGKLFTDNSSFGATEFLWDFGDGSTSTQYEPDHQYKEAGTYDVTLVASNAHQCRDTLKIDAAVRVVNGGQLLIPNAFSPNMAGPGNSGGQNDVFRPLIQQVSEFQLLIFNRWGELLFETNNPEEGWDGYHRGKLCPQDVYVYKITARYATGELVTRVGDVHLIR